MSPEKETWLPVHPKFCNLQMPSLCYLWCVSWNESRLQARARKAGVQLVADTVVFSTMQENISVKWRKTHKERKYDVIDSQYWHKWV